MSLTVFIGDETSATGWRMAGVEVVSPAAGEVGRVLDAARRRADLVILTAESARALAPADLEAALLAEAPIVSVVSDILGRVPLPDLAGRLRRTLGIDT